jgi:hypothetical protein
MLGKGCVHRPGGEFAGNGAGHFTGGIAMRKKLRMEDRYAADLLLDRMPTAAKANGQAIHADLHTGLRPRVQRLQQLLHLLELTPIEEPPRDLVLRTIEKIDFAAAHSALPASIQPGHHPGPVV